MTQLPRRNDAQPGSGRARDRRNDAGGHGLRVRTAGGDNPGPIGEVEPDDHHRPGADGRPRYCQLTEQLEAYGREAFAGLGRDATAAEYRRVERRSVLDNAAALRGLEAAVPEQLRDDVRTFVTSMRQRGGLEPAGTVTQADASVAEQAVRAYERRVCRE